MRTCLTRLPLILLLLSGTPVCAQRLPAGFEDLAEGHAERVEVRAFGRSAGLWSVWVTLDQVQLEQPMKVLAALGLDAEAQAARCRRSPRRCRGTVTWPACTRSFNQAAAGAPHRRIPLS